MQSRTTDYPTSAPLARPENGYLAPKPPHCPACGASVTTVFYEMDGVPVHSCLLVDSRNEALAYPTGQIRLGFCDSCGFIANLAFDPTHLDYSAAYEETQGFSSRFNAFAHDLASSLVDRYDIRNKSILEIGAGKGEFLAVLCELGNNRGTGIDPAYVKGRISPEAEARLEFITDFYSERYSHLSGDVVCCRHTLEHIQPVEQFLRVVRRSIGDRRDTVVVFEVPDVSRVLRETAFWDIYYEHCSYFSLGSLARLFRACDFEILDLYAAFDDQYLLIEAKPGLQTAQPSLPGEEDMEALRQDVLYFTANHATNLQQYRAHMERIRGRGQKAVLWGSGSKAVAYLNALHIDDEIEFVVDINPFKHGKYLAGSGHEIVPPEFLKTYAPDIVIAMNPIYCDEIRAQLKHLAVPAEVVAV